LEEGGYLLLSFRDDNFCYWLHGVFDDNTTSRVKDTFRTYWNTRSKLGIRNFDQMYNVISPVQSVRFAEGLGFERVDRVRVNTVRSYQLMRQHFCPTGDEPACWNIAKIGVTSEDRRDLQHCSWPNTIEDTLCETMVVYLLRKK
jgi:hypothetical protein